MLEFIVGFSVGVAAGAWFTGPPAEPMKRIGCVGWVEMVWAWKERSVLDSTSS